MNPRTALLLVTLLYLQVTGGSTDREERRFFQNMFNSRPLRDEPKTCSCICGERNDASRIVGGKPADSNAFPWLVRLSYFNRFYCGGMLINDRYVLTAAHCVKGFMWFMIKVTFGEHDRCDKAIKPETRFVLRAVTGDFSYLNFDNDIAILRLNDKVPITETIRPICLPAKSNNLYVGAKAIASGWGTLKEDGKPACILQEVELPVMSNDQCKLTNYNEKMISDNMLCAGYLEGLKDSCQGDSGGPLIREKADRRYELIGVVSWGNGCARPGYPGIYTRVTRYLDWIRENTASGCWCEDSAKEQLEPDPPQKNGNTTAGIQATKEKEDKTPSNQSTVKQQDQTTERQKEQTTERLGDETVEKHGVQTTDKVDQPIKVQVNQTMGSEDDKSKVNQEDKITTDKTSNDKVSEITTV